MIKSIYILIGTRPNFLKITQFKKWAPQFGVKPILKTINALENGSYKKGQTPTLWDGLANKRILEIISNSNNN